MSDEENKPVLTPDQEAEGWRVVKQGGMWVKTLDLGAVPLRLGHDPEICICSAIRLSDGRILRGHRHSDCIRTAHDLVEYLEPGSWDAKHRRHEQGFITSRNRYVGREEGLRLQHAAGIPSACRSGYRARQLFSEDLY